MKLTFFFLTAAFLQVAAKGTAQTVTFSGKNVKLENVLNQIEKQTGFVFFYSTEDIKISRPVTVSLRNIPLKEALKMIMADQPLNYIIKDNTIFIKKTDEKTEVNVKPPLVNITGNVKDETGKPISSASVTVPGTPIGAVTNDRGDFSLNNVPEKAKLVISHIGYESQTIPVNGKNSFDIVLKIQVKSLDETVIIGYGTTTKRVSTASVSSITAEDISKQPVSNPLDALEGRIAGAQITQQNGLPGSRVSILIRGINSLGNGTVPLFIIDGVPFNVNDQAVPAQNDLNSFSFSAANGGISPFSMIDPAEIERIDVLKDADATAIYGTRGANGVVLITTKRGKAGKTKFDLNIYQGAGVVSHYIDMLNLPQYIALRRKALANDGITPTAANAPDLFVYDTTQYTNWQKKYIGGTAKITDVQGTLSGGDYQTRFLFGSGYHRETTVFPGDLSDQRASVRFSLDHNSLNKKFTASLTGNYSFDLSNLIGVDLSSVYNLPPDYKLYNPDGTLFWDANYTNPEARLFQTYIGKTNTLISNSQLKYTILPGLDLKANMGFTKIDLNQNLQTPVKAQNPNVSPTNNAQFGNVSQQSYIVEPQATYVKKFGNSKISALAGATWQRSLNTTISITGTNYSNPNLLGSITGAASYNVSGTNTLYKYNSFFGRITYDWKETYIIDANGRRDGSSRFGPNYKFGNFGSIGAAWVFTNEKFVQNILSSVVSFGKIRTSYGITGNDQIQDYQFLATYGAGSASSAYQGISILTPSRAANPNMHWETNKKFEIALDLGLFNNRAIVTADYYRNRSNNQLSYLSLPWITGFNSITDNFQALLQNKGFEFEVTAKNIIRGNFRWETSLNVTIPKTQILSLDPHYFYTSSYVLGNSINQQLRYTYMGVDPATGKPLFKNVAKDSLTFVPNFSTDRSLIGNTDPKYYGGINNNFQFKNWNFSFFVQVMEKNGNVFPAGTPGFAGGIPGALGNVPTYWLQGMWQQAGDNAALPRASTLSSIYSSLTSSNFIWGNASYVKLRNVSLSYTLPAHLISNLKLSSCRLYAQGQNLYTWTKYKIAFDPETGTAMPPLRVITFGINATF